MEKANQQIALRIKISLGIVVFLVSLKFLLVPFFSWQVTRVDEIKNLTKRIEKAYSLKQSQEELKHSLDVLNSFLAKYRKYFYEKTETPEKIQLYVQKEIQNIARATGFQVKSLDWLYPSEDDLIKVPVKIVAVCNFESLCNFLYKLETFVPNLVI